MKIIFNQKDVTCTKIQYSFTAWALHSVKEQNDNISGRNKKPSKVQDTERGHGTLKHCDQDWDLPISQLWQETLSSGSVTKQRGKDGLEIVLCSSDPQLLTEAQIPNCLCTHPLSSWQKLCSCFPAAGFHIRSPFFTISLSQVYRKHVPSCQACDRGKKPTKKNPMSYGSWASWFVPVLPSSLTTAS